jgi:hypothetical protein
MIDRGRPACFMADKKGYLPAHVACSRHCSPEKLNMLLQVYPGSLYETTQQGYTLLDLAKSTATKSHPNYALIDELHKQLSLHAPQQIIPLMHQQQQYYPPPRRYSTYSPPRMEQQQQYTRISVGESDHSSRRLDASRKRPRPERIDPVVLLLEFSQHSSNHHHAYDNSPSNSNHTSMHPQIPSDESSHSSTHSDSSPFHPDAIELAQV